MEHISFMYSRDLMIEVALEQHDKSQAQILIGYGLVEGILQVERLIKPTDFTIAQSLE